MQRVVLETVDRMLRGDCAMRELDWDLLLSRIKRGECTPFLGAGASAGLVPLAKDLAKGYASEYHYPFPDTTDLERALASTDPPLTAAKQLLAENLLHQIRHQATR